ncbi:MAG: choice-of-anchor L domain-containing protein [Bacteroidota bacterium]
MRFFTQLTLKAILLGFLFSPLSGSANDSDGNVTDNLPIFEIMTVVDHQHRFPFQIHESEGLIELCGLNVGGQYSMILNIDEEFSRCILELSDIGAEDKLIHYPSKNRINDRLRYFTADAECMQFKVNNLNCHPGQSYKAWLSLLCESCDKKGKGLAGAISEAALAEISVGGGISSVELIQDVFIAGGCFEVTNVIPIGDAAGRGTFANGMTTVNMDDGVILACGDVTNALGPNDGTGTSTNFGDTSGDPDLDILGGGVDIRDAVGIEFTVEPTIDQIEFQYAFASEEYCDFVGTQFNDVFGFFISGLGINGGFSNGGENIAQIPGGGGPVAINSVNHVTNTQYFNPNAGPGGAYCDAPAIAINDIEYDGFTTVFTAVANVVPCRQYTIRLVVADRSDHIFDSAVFLKGNSFEAGGEASLDFNVFFDELIEQGLPQY